MSIDLPAVLAGGVFKCRYSGATTTCDAGHPSIGLSFKAAPSAMWIDARFTGAWIVLVTLKRLWYMKLR